MTKIVLILKRIFHSTDFWLLVCLSLFCAYLMWHTFSYHDHTFYISHKVWSDFGAHLPLIRSFSKGFNFPPEYPTFPHAPIKYHFLFYLSIGLLELLGLNLATAINLASAFGLTLLGYLIFRLARSLSGHWLPGIIALLLVFFNGSWSFLAFFQAHPLSLQSFRQIVTAESFASFGPWDGQIVSAFWNLNIYTNQRHLGLSFACGFLVLWPLLLTATQLHCRSSPKLTWLALYPLWFLIPFLHQAVLVMVYLISTLIFIGLWRQTKTLFLPYCLGLLLTLPGLTYWWSAGAVPPQFELGFLSPQKNILGILWYWLNNLGLYLPLIPLIFIFLPRNRRLIFTAFLSLFIVANLYRFSPDMINNHKLINFFQLYLAVETAIFLYQLRSFRGGSILSGLLFFILTFSGFIDLFPLINDSVGRIPDIPYNQTAAWIASHTPPRSVFLTTTYFYHPASLAGRRLFLDYGYFNWSIGYQEADRRRFINDLFTNRLTLANACHQFNQYGLDYLDISSGHGDLGNLNPHQLKLLVSASPLYTSASGDKIYSVNQLCYDQN